MTLPPGTRRIDGRGKFLMPGLADMHVHLTREEDLGLYVARGVTTVRNMWGTPMHLAFRDRIRRGSLLGPTIYTAGPIIDGDPPVHPGSLVVHDAAEADRAVRLHREAGYDFMKVYSRLKAPAFGALLAAAAKAGVPVVGHIPREIGLAGAVAAGQHGIEHMNPFLEALQSSTSPVAGRFDGDSQARKIDFIDETRIPGLVKQLRERDVWVCPTLNLWNQLAPAAEVRKRLERPEMRYVPPCDIAIWSPEEDPPPPAMAARQREIALGRKMIRALRDGGVHLLLGTDTGNPLVVPGFTVHEELEQLVQAGLTPYEALRAGTRNAAEMMHAEGELGSVAVGLRADLLLVDGNPLSDVTQADRISGVMVRGRWLDEKERAALLAQSERWAQGHTDPFAHVPALPSEGEREFAATYAVTWKGVPFDTERVRVERTADGQRIIAAQTIDPHTGQWMTARLWPGVSGLGERLVLESDGANGRGRVEVTRAGARAEIRGTLLAGDPASLAADLPADVVLGMDHFLASKYLLVSSIAGLEVGASREVRVSEVALGSSVALPIRASKITRVADQTIESEHSPLVVRRFEVATGKGPPDILAIDAEDRIVDYRITSFEVRFTRVAR